jgi:hypothetical protein
MNSHPAIFTFGEIMHRNVVRSVRDPIRYAEGVCSMSRSAVTGFKVKVQQIERDQGHNARDMLLRFHARGWKLINLRRTNLVRHAISDIKSEKTGRYHDVKGSADGGLRTAHRRIRIEPAELTDGIAFLERSLEREERALESLPHLRIEYEKDLLGPEAQRESMLRVFDYLGLPAHDAQTAFRKVTSRNMSEEIENFRELEQQLERAGYAHYLGWG